VVRRRNKVATREDILAAARTVLASDGPDALSLSKVANLAGVNRGTAYQHFETREELIKATVESVGQHLSTTIFGNLSLDDEGHWKGGDERPVEVVVSGLVDFAVENPALCRIWLFEVLSSKNPSDDLFFRQFKESTRELTETKYAQEGVDVEAKTTAQRKKMASRMRHEVLRLLLYGVLKAEKFPQVRELLNK